MSLLPPFDVAQVRGHDVSRTSAILRFDAMLISGWTAIDYKSSRAPGKSSYSRSKPQARTRGKMTYTASVTLSEREAGVLRDYLAAKGAPARTGWSETEFTVTLTYFEPSLGPGVQTVVLVAAQATEFDRSISDSDDPLMVKVTLDVMDILENGLSAVVENTATGN